ncbi:MAG: DUF4391 domain-containing protein [Bacteroidaceae bacterium]|nr:DUF4391 domain-containing protein [Bacteroidaceae bacterium]
MYGLPATTIINKPIYKKALFEKYNMKEPDAFNADISRLLLLARVSSATVPALKPGKEMEGFYVLQVMMKRRDYDVKSFVLLRKLIPQDLVFALQYEDETQFLIFHSSYHLHTEWMPTEEATIPLQGITIDDALQNIIATIGHLEAHADKSFEEQLHEREHREHLLSKIETLEKRCRAEKQTRKKYELHQQILKLKEEL